MPPWSAIFPHSADFDPAGDFEAFSKAVPARWVVYLMSDEADRPVQLLCVRNLRNSLKRRLGLDEVAVPSKRVDYRELIRRVHWVRVNNAFESDWVYLEAARQCFPAQYEKMIGFRPAWFLHVNPEADFPKYTRTTDLSLKAGKYFGPMEDKVVASRLIEMLEDAFDLCRYYNILQQSPKGLPCAYKEMGKCPAPCDGSISIEQYRRLMEMSTRAITDPAELQREHVARMKSAAIDLRFETAGKIKQYIDQLDAMHRGPFQFVARLSDFAFVSLQHSQKEAAAEVFLITTGAIEQIATILSEAGVSPELMTTIYRRSESSSTLSVDRIAQERIAVVAAQLFATKKSRGTFVRLGELNESLLVDAYRELRKQIPMESGSDEEGIVKELQTGNS